MIELENGNALLVKMEIQYVANLIELFARVYFKQSGFV